MKTNASEPARLVLRLPPDVHQLLRERSAEHERSLNSEIVYALRIYLRGIRRIEYVWDEPEEDTRAAWTALAGETLSEEEDGWDFTPEEQAEVERLREARR